MTTWVEYKKSNDIPEDITLNKRGVFILRTGFIHKAKLGKEISHAKLYFSRKNHAVALKFYSKDDDAYISFNECVAVHNAALSPCKYIAVARFFSFNFIDKSKYVGKYMANLENIPEIGEAWVIYLKEKD